jgi:L-amino acid N-acyltransferase YncA
MRYLIIPMVPAVWPAVRRIYAEGIATGNATFETDVPEWEKWDANHRKDCRLMAAEPEQDNAEFLVTGKITILGWAALSPVSSRHVYRGVAEVSVYIAVAARGRGLGKALLEALVQESESVGIWTLQAGIFPENVASLALHRSCGFREVGIRRRLGLLHGVWRDVLLLERRSVKVGA